MFSHFVSHRVTLEGSLTMTAGENNIPLVCFVDPALL